MVFERIRLDSEEKICYFAGWIHAGSGPIVRWKDKVDIIERIKIWAGACAQSTELQNLKDAADKAQRAIQVAQGVAAFVKMNGDSAAKLGKASEAVGKVSETLGKDGIIQQDPDRAALAFGKLFAGFGRLANHLPPPANAYAQILEGCGDFFYNMRQKLDPERRWQKQFREIDGF
jgi:hypothetical protein